MQMTRQTDTVQGFIDQMKLQKLTVMRQARVKTGNVVQTGEQIHRSRQEIQGPKDQAEVQTRQETNRQTGRCRCRCRFRFWLESKGMMYMATLTIWQRNSGSGLVYIVSG